MEFGGLLRTSTGRPHELLIINATTGLKLRGLFILKTNNSV